MVIRILAMAEVLEDAPPGNIVDIRTGLPMVAAQPAEEVEIIFVRTSCIVCGSPFWWARVAGRPGRQRRFCSPTCKGQRHQHQVQHSRRAQASAGMADLFAEVDRGSSWRSSPPAGNSIPVIGLVTGNQKQGNAGNEVTP